MLHHAQSKTTTLHHSDRIIVMGIQLAQESRIYMDYSVIHNHCSFHINNILKNYHIVPNDCTTNTKLLACPKHALHAPSIIIMLVSVHVHRAGPTQHKPHIVLLLIACLLRFKAAKERCVFSHVLCKSRDLIVSATQTTPKVDGFFLVL